ncbi:SDR family NAD(P)-dependent oxidoreductase, partial [Mesorhizobium metallidurans]|uniref:SDR family NAD(P)-dependent oxidoreductase n=1 Tax=Mesorhizobium metallidurans TaxID=489722 RepID=UPI00058C4EA0
METSLEQKNALVTGGVRGIGRAIALRLSTQGARVAIGYVKNDARADEALKAIGEAGGQGVAIKADLSLPREVARMFDEAEQKTGPLDIVVASAADMMVKPLVDCTEEDYDRIFNTNA